MTKSRPLFSFPVSFLESSGAVSFIFKREWKTIWTNANFYFKNFTESCWVSSSCIQYYWNLQNVSSFFKLGNKFPFFLIQCILFMVSLLRSSQVLPTSPPTGICNSLFLSLIRKQIGNNLHLSQPVANWPALGGRQGRCPSTLPGRWKPVGVHSVVEGCESRSLGLEGYLLGAVKTCEGVSRDSTWGEGCRGTDRLETDGWGTYTVSWTAGAFQAGEWAFLMMRKISSEFPEDLAVKNPLKRSPTVASPHHPVTTHVSLGLCSLIQTSLLLCFQELGLPYAPHLAPGN